MRTRSTSFHIRSLLYFLTIWALQFSQNAYSLVCMTSKFSVEGDKVFFIFHSDKRLVNADAASFALIPDSTDVCKNNTYGRDKDSVFSGANKLTGADAATFQSVSGSSYIFKDKYAVYYSNNPQPGIDPSSFTHIKSAIKNGSYVVRLFRDKESALILQDESFKRLTNVDIKSARLMGGDTDYITTKYPTDIFIVDNNQVLHGKTLERTKFDPDSFATQGPFSKDKTQLECHGKSIGVTKPSTIVLRKDGIALFDDKALLLCETLITGVDPNTFDIKLFRAGRSLKEVAVDARTIFDKSGYVVCLRGKNDSEGLPTCK